MAQTAYCDPLCFGEFRQALESGQYRQLMSPGRVESLTSDPLVDWSHGLPARHSDLVRCGVQL
jgi:hypothetical protein